METVIFEIENEEDPRLLRAAEILRSGGTVIFPTETVYGLGANALSDTAVRRIFAAKGRPSDNPVIVHIAQWSQIYDVASVVPIEAERLAEQFWPGPLTMIMPKSQAVPMGVTGGLNTVAVRLPEHPVARKLIALAGVPVAAPSANISGKPSPTGPEHVIKDMCGKVDCIVCSGESRGGVESTVVDLTVTPPVILRPGGVTYEQLIRVIPGIVLDPALSGDREDAAPKSPGMKYAHYAPDAPMTVYEGDTEKVVLAMLEAIRTNDSEGKRTGILGYTETQERFEGTGAAFYDLGSIRKPEDAARLLFHRLRACNDDGVNAVLAHGISESGLGLAVMNRMRKAAGNNVIRV